MNAVGMKTAERTSATAITAPANLIHRLPRGIARRHAETKFMLHGLDDNNGVVNDDADGKDEAEERDRIKRKPESRHGGKRADERYRNCDEWDNRRPPGLQKEHHHDSRPARWLR